MTINPDLRLKIRHFFQKYQKIIIVVVVVLLLLITIQRILMKMNKPQSPQTTYTPHSSIINNYDNDEVPTKVASSFEDFIDKYVIYCNTGEYVKAWNLISEDCKVNFFDNDYDSFVEYVKSKFNSRKRYAIQDYSNYNDKYIYSVKIFDDYLATGLTNQTYLYQEEKMVASYDENKNVVFSVGNYMGSQSLNYMSANNDYLKVSVNEVIEKYNFVIYTVEFTNRSNYTVVIQDGNSDSTEILLNVGSENRGTEDTFDIVLDPLEKRTVKLSFAKFYDSNSVVNGLILNSVRVMENYTGNPDTAEAEIANAIDKFSMTVSFK